MSSSALSLSGKGATKDQATSHILCVFTGLPIFLAQSFTYPPQASGRNSSAFQLQRKKTPLQAVIRGQDGPSVSSSGRILRGHGPGRHFRQSGRSIALDVFHLCALWWLTSPTTQLRIHCNLNTGCLWHIIKNTPCSFMFLINKLIINFQLPATTTNSLS